MKISTIGFLTELPAKSFCFTSLKEVAGGTIRRFENFSSQYILPRNIDVWLPKDYTPNEKYSVLYMHDGQMLFDSTITWNQKEWSVDKIITDLTSRAEIKNVIVVGIWNSGTNRHAEYFPEKPLSYLPAHLRDTLVSEVLGGHPQADNYLLFLTNELKPFIDEAFSTASDRTNTFIAGSSMGALISLYALCEYPEVFGGVACLSTHWIGSTKHKHDCIPGAFVSYLSQMLPSPLTHAIYFDYGTNSLDSLYKPHQLAVDDIMKAKGFNSTSWITKEFEGHDHSEDSWSSRLHIPLKFLLAKEHEKANLVSDVEVGLQQYNAA